MTSRILAIDIGTSSTRGLVVDAAGAILGQHAVGYGLAAPRPGHAEQDPAEILRAVEAVLAACGTPGMPLVFSSAMHSLIGLDAAGALVTPMWTWADQRSDAVAQELRAGPQAEALHRRTGTPLHPMSPLCKIRYLRTCEPEIFDRIARFVSIKEFVFESLFGARCVDHSVASASGLFAVADGDWDPLALEIAGIGPSALSPLVPTTEVLAGKGREVVVGATDGVLANLGVAPEMAGDGRGVRAACLTLGTSGAARLTVDAPRTDPTGRLFCYVLDDRRWVVGGAVNNGGLVMRWLRDLFGIPKTKERTAALLAELEQIPPGADGLRCVPCLTGERYPTYRTGGGGQMSGLTVNHGAAHVQRAALEGMMLAFAPLIADLEASDGGGPLDEIRIGGGMFAWPFFRQLLADVVGRRVVMPESVESSALGAARLGFAALGVDVAWDLEFPYVHDPDPSRHPTYRALAAIPT